MEAKKALVRKNFDGSAEFARTVITNIVYFVSGVLVSKGAMLGNLSPFGASFAAAVPKKYLLSALAGTGLGYILLTPADSFRYIAVVVAIGGIRWLTSDIKRVKNSALFAPLVAFLPILERVLYSHLSAQARFPRLPTALSRRCLQVRRLIFSAVR